MTRRRLTIASFATVLALALPALTLALPREVNALLLGPKMIRSDIFVQTRDGIQHEFRLDRGRLLKRYSKSQLVIAERDGTKVSVRVASSASVLLNGKPSNLRVLRPNMQVVVSHDRDQPADAVWASSTKVAPKVPAVVGSFLLGNRLVRAELAVQSADPRAPHDYLLDRGRIKQVGAFTLALRELDRTTVQINVSPLARIRLNGRDTSFAQLKRGMMATTMRDGVDKPADQVFANGR